MPSVGPPAPGPATRPSPRRGSVLVPALLALTGIAVGVIGPGAVQPQQTSSLRSLYVLHCAGCHNLDGSGHPDQGVPSMRGTLGHFMSLPEGRAFLVQVPGVNNAGLSDAQIAALTNWTVRTFSADTAPAGWAPYTEAEVTEAKRHRPLDVAKARAALVERLGPAMAGR